MPIESLSDITRGATSAFASGADSIGIVCSDEATALVTGANVITFHMPYALTLTEVFCGLSTPQTSGTAVEVDVLAGGASVFSTTITVDNTEDTSLTAAVPAVLSTTALTKGQKIQVSILSVGGTTAKGLKVYLVGYIP